MREIFYCDVEQCSSTGTFILIDFFFFFLNFAPTIPLGGEEEYVYSCEKTDCYFTGHLHWSDPWINIVENGIFFNFFFFFFLLADLFSKRVERLVDIHMPNG